MDSLIVHEHHDDQRTPPLIEKLRESGILRNPPIVAPIMDGSGRYIVLDGANRTTALSKMGIPHMIAQVVEPDSDHLELKTWNHVIWGMQPSQLISALEEIPNLAIHEIENEEEGLRKLANTTAIIWIQTAEHKTFMGISPDDDLPSRLITLNQIMNSYKADAKLDRTRVRDIAGLKGIYQNLTGIVVYPHFKIKEVIELCSQGHLFPAGVTRFTVAPRALRVNYPLDEMASEKSLEEKVKTLEKWLQDRMSKKGVRFYAEPTVLFDE